MRIYIVIIVSVFFWGFGAFASPECEAELQPLTQRMLQEEANCNGGAIGGDGTFVSNGNLGLPNGFDRTYSCAAYSSLSAEVASSYRTCVSNIEARRICETSSTSVWQSDGGPLLSGRCMVCPAGTTPLDLSSGNRALVNCQCNNDESKLIAANGGDIAACEPEVNSGEGCGEDPRSQGGYADDGDIVAYDSCMQELRQAEIEAQRIRNQSAADAMAMAEAEADRDQEIENVRGQLRSSCETQYQDFISQCRTVAAQAPPQTSSNRNAGSVEACRSLQQSSEDVVTQVQRQVDNCMSLRESVLNSCADSTGTLSGSGSGVVSTGSETLGPGVVAEASRTAQGSGEIPANSATIQNAGQIFSELTTLSSEVNAEMTRIREEADRCIAAFEQDPNNGGGSNWGGLAQTAAQAFGKLDGSDGSLDGGDLGSGGAAATAPGFQGSSAGVGGPSSANRSGLEGFNGGDGGASRGLGDGLNPTGPTNRGPASAGGANAGGMMGGMGMPMGAGVGRGAGGSGSGGSASNSRGRRNFTKSEDRNLVLGYKKVKKGEQPVTYHPNDLKKIGKAKMLEKLEEAKKKFGKETPLLFKNGKFVRDYLEMKNRLAWQKHNLRQKNRLSGIFNSKKEQEAKAFHQCALYGECYTEARYNIFKLHHFKAIKHIGK